MKNLVSNFTPAIEADTNDEGVSALEYLVLGTVVVAAVSVGAVALAGKIGPAFTTLAGLI
jgi:hypothetical protein